MSDAPAPKSKLARLKRLAIDLVLFVLVLMAIGMYQRRNLLPADRTPAPALQALTLDGERVSLADFEGQPVQLHFWGTWCKVCRQEHGALNAVHAANQGTDRQLIAIAVDSGSLAQLTEYAEDKDLAYTIWLDPDGSAAAAYNVSTYPTNYYLNADHEIVWRDVGMATRWGMRIRSWQAARD